MWNALTLALRENPRDYLARIIAMLPKQVSFEHSVIAELDDSELDRAIETLRTRALAAQYLAPSIATATTSKHTAICFID